MIDIKIFDRPLSLDKCYELAKSDSSGAVALFVGTVRNHTKERSVVKLEFEAFESMAIKEMTKIANQIIEKWRPDSVVMHHRVGPLVVSEIAVIIAVASAHRGVAFEACQFAIDTLKETVPIWKKEIFEDGEIWVSAHP